jgi:hypothetical protein
MLSKIILLISLVILGWLIFTGQLQLKNTNEILKIDVSQFVEQFGMDEYAVASRKTNETFITTKFGAIKDTNAEISLVANYKFYIKFAELKYHIENGVVFVDAPRLYLSTPIAFNFDTVREKCDGLFGLDCNELLEQLKQDISADLVSKGLHQIPTMYDTSAKALADNLNNHFTANGHNYYYKSIVVSFIAEGSKSQRVFNYNSEFCDKEPCLFRFNLDKKANQ